MSGLGFNESFEYKYLSSKCKGLLVQFVPWCSKREKCFLYKPLNSKYKGQSVLIYWLEKVQVSHSSVLSLVLYSMSHGCKWWVKQPDWWLHFSIYSLQEGFSFSTENKRLAVSAADVIPFKWEKCKKFFAVFQGNFSFFSLLSNRQWIQRIHFKAPCIVAAYCRMRLRQRWNNVVSNSIVKGLWWADLRPQSKEEKNLCSWMFD